jgi:zinc transporter 1/2/3
VIAIKLMFMLAVLVAGALGGALPLRASGELRTGRFLGLGNATAAGVFLGAGLIHMLPDADETWRSLGFDYPMAFALATLAFVLMLLFEHVLLPDSAHQAMHAPSNELFSHVIAHSHGGFEAYAVLTALSVHSFLAGAALGAQAQLAGAVVIFTAIMVHKSMAGFALGVSLVRSGLTSRRSWQLLGLFSVMTPLGVVLGASLGESLQGRAQQIAQASLQALGAGTFAYVATMDILRDELLVPGGRGSKWLLVFCGAGSMALLAIWV